MFVTYIFNLKKKKNIKKNNKQTHTMPSYVANSRELESFLRLKFNKCITCTAHNTQNNATKHQKHQYNIFTKRSLQFYFSTKTEELDKIKRRPQQFFFRKAQVFLVVTPKFFREHNIFWSDRFHFL